MKVGAWPSDDKKRVEFVVWAPHRKNVEAEIIAPDPQRVILEKDDRGYWRGTAKVDPSGCQYMFVLDNNLKRPDPASCFQPEGVHEPSEVVDHSSFEWSDADWKNLEFNKMIMYELHVGTFTPDGNFDAIISKLEYLHELGINAIDIMPVSQFPGTRNWGYDGVHPYSVQNSYGGPDGLKRLVDAAHKKGMAVIMDVVYNHLGPEGNYLHDFGPYFTSKYKTPWGMALNFDSAYSDEVRNYFIENAICWFEDYHIDALRLDAIHGIFDNSAHPFLMELAERVDEFADKKGRPCYLISESDLNDSRVIRPRVNNGFGHRAQWSDDFHHSVHTLLTGENSGYYKDFGYIDDLAIALKEGYTYSGRYSEFRKRSHGNSSADCPADQFVISIQNHDQVGNRLYGERLSSLVSFEALKLAAATMILSPNIPMLFMGEEYAEEAPFLYFISHTDKDLVEAVRKGRKEEFESFEWTEEPPDPQSKETFEKSRLNWDAHNQGKHKTMLEFYKMLIKMRKNTPALSRTTKRGLGVATDIDRNILFVERKQSDNITRLIFNFSEEKMKFAFSTSGGSWNLLLDSSDRKWSGSGSKLPKAISSDTTFEINPLNIVVYDKETD